MSLVSRQTTRIVVRLGKVVERSFEQFVEVPVPAALQPGNAATAPRVQWTETGAEIGTHGDGAAPARTVDELYDEAVALLEKPVAEHKERSLAINECGILDHCFDRDMRIADDVPLEGVKPFLVMFDAP